MMGDRANPDANGFRGSDGPTEFIRTLDGRRAQEHRYDQMDEEELARSIDERRNVVVGDRVYHGAEETDSGQQTGREA